MRFEPAGGIILVEKSNEGIETALATLHTFFLYHGLIVISSAAAYKYGIGPTSSDLDGMLITEDKPDVVKRDEAGMNSAKVLVKKVGEMAEMIRKARG